MKKEMDGMTKLEPIKNDDFRQAQEYFKNKSIENGRMAFRITARCWTISQETSKINTEKIKKN
jgi:hypothetical protein